MLPKRALVPACMVAIGSHLDDQRVRYTFIVFVPVESLSSTTFLAGSGVARVGFKCRPHSNLLSPSLFCYRQHNLGAKISLHTFP